MRANWQGGHLGLLTFWASIPGWAQADPPATEPPAAAPTAAPAPDPAPPPVAAPEPAPAPPPSAWPYPYPPPPGYAAAPPPAYYPYAPPSERERVRRPPKPEYPEDAAVQTSPWIDALAPALYFNDRFDSAFDFGLQGGGYLGHAVRLAARVVFHTGNDEEDYYFSSPNAAGYYYPSTESPSLMYGASAGVIAFGGSKFVMSPGIAFLRTDVSEHGTFLALSLPFEWTLRNGVRIGFELGLGNVQGASEVESCERAVATDCPDGITRSQDADSSFALYAQFQIGYGFGHPGPTKQPAAAE